MSDTGVSGLVSLAQELTDLVGKSASGVVAVKASAYRGASGVAISRDLIAVTEHSVRQAERLEIVTAGGRHGKANVLGRDSSLDIAILKTEGSELTPLEPTDASAIRAGELAVVVGMTADVGPSTSLGIVGAVGGARRTWRGGSLDHFFRLGVNLYPSQTGAAVINMEGQLIGLATPALLRHSAVAVPFVTLRRIADELAKEGRIRRGYLGVGIQPVVVPPVLREKTGMDVPSGLMLLNVEAGSPAERAELQLGDILVQLNGKAMSDVEDLQDALRGDAVGRAVAGVVIRGGGRTDIQIDIAERSSSRERKEKGE
jgi:serine protease Do